MHVAFFSKYLSQFSGVEFPNENVIFRSLNPDTIDQKILMPSKLLCEGFKRHSSADDTRFDALISLFCAYLYGCDFSELCRTTSAVVPKMVNTAVEILGREIPIFSGLGITPGPLHLE